MIRINLAPPLERPRGGGLSPMILGAAFIAVLVGLGWWYAALIRGEAHLTEQIAILTRDLTALQAMRGRGESARDTMGDLARRTQAIHELTRGHDLVLRVLDAVLDAVPHDLWLTALEGRARELRAAGSARSAGAVADFTSSLRASGKFKDVEIVMSRQDLGKTPSGPVSFEVACRFGP
jgi:Tfp pilus assembly protein PilN